MFYKKLIIFREESKPEWEFVFLQEKSYKCIFFSNEKKSHSDSEWQRNFE